MIFCYSSQHQYLGYPLYILMLHTCQGFFALRLSLRIARSNLFPWNSLSAPCMSVQFFDKAILNKLVCKFYRIENSSFLLCKYILIANIDMLLPNYTTYSLSFSSLK